MAKFFLFLTIIASIAAGVLGYFTYAKVNEVKNTVVLVKKDLADTKTTLEKNKFALKDAQDQLSATKSQLDTANETIKTVQAKVDALTQNVTDLQSQLDAKTAEAQKLKDQIIASGGGSKDQTDNTNPLVAKIKDLQAQLDESKQLATTLQSKADEAEKHADELVKKDQEHQAILNRPGLEGVVMAVNPGWNFAVISIGDRQGAVPNAEVLIKRGDALIAKVKITSVEPATSIGDILPDTLAKGQRVLPGDRVIFTGQSAQ
jgi:hypothetical protein